MTLATGTKLGPYEILGQIGAGGMGEVYKARDPRLNREVAIKVLPEDFLEGEENRERFEREARLLAALNHPGIAAIYSFEEIPGSSSSSSSAFSSSRHILVMELLEGESLRDRLRAGAMAPKKAFELAAQMAEGLAAAHARGIVHRDVKPENIFISRDGRVKLLDFGLAKQLPSWAGRSGPQTSVPTEAGGSRPTQAGVVMGTVGYMSPEQVRGESADHRSDIFSFGVVLYEMLSGKKAFEGKSAVETLNAILHDDPDALVVTKGQMPPVLERLVLHCLEKSPENRFQSMKDLAFDLQAISTISTVDGGRPKARAKSERGRWAVLGAAVVLAAALATWLSGAVHVGRHTQPSFQQISFRQGRIGKARFAPGGQDVIYDASWQGEPWQLFSTPVADPKERPLGQGDVQLMDLSPAGEMALRLKSKVADTWQFEGTLARSAVGGDLAPKALLGGVLQSASGPKGEFALVRQAGGRTFLEYPQGKVRVESAGWFGDLRFSSDGKLLAYVDHPAAGDDAGRVSILDVDSGKTRILSKDHDTLRGLAWSGKEIWFTAGTNVLNRALHAVDLSGKERRVFSQAGGLSIHDVGTDGRVLMSREEMRGGLLAQADGQAQPVDLSWRTWSYLLDCSSDGKMLLFEEEEGPLPDLFLRPAAGGHATPLGKSNGWGALSPDEALAAAWVDKPAAHWVLYPTGTGSPRELPAHGIRSIKAVSFQKDGKSLIFIGAEKEKEDRVWTQGLEGAAPKAITPEGVTGLDTWPFLSPDGRSILVREKAGWGILDLRNPEAPARRVTGLEEGERLIQWTPDGRFYASRPGSFPIEVWKLDPLTGKRQPWKVVNPAGYVGVEATSMRFSEVGRQMAARYILQRSTLYVVEGLR
ncbi:MAG: WD40 repeat domain-containing serine/threonine protein kinase [Acidobacteriota bacterium]|nr:WD40 repeat domain-containing serine/threonine protein kinase [Acidobacteriota bacterium]